MRVFMVCLLLLFSIFPITSFAQTKDISLDLLNAKLRLLEKSLASIQKKNHLQAIPNLEKAILIEADAETLLLLGTAYFYTRQLKQAQRALTRALKLHPDSETRENAEYFLEQIQETINQGDWVSNNPAWLDFDFSFGNNSNLDQSSHQEKSTGVTELNFGISGGYVFQQGKPFFIRTQYQLAWNEVVNAKDHRVTSENISANFTYQKGQYLFQLTPALNYQTYGSSLEAYLLNPSLGVRIEKRWGAPGIGMSYQFVKDGSQNQNYSYLSGFTQSEKFYLSYYAENALITFSFLTLQNQIGDLHFADGSLLPESYTAYGLSLDLYYFINTRLDLSLTPSFIHKNFNADPSPNLGYGRSDETYSIQAKLNYWIHPNFKIYFSESYQSNDSSLGNNDIANPNYSQNIALLGFTYQWLH